jgi:hypothetical protein
MPRARVQAGFRAARKHSCMSTNFGGMLHAGCGRLKEALFNHPGGIATQEPQELSSAPADLARSVLSYLVEASTRFIVDSCLGFPYAFVAQKRHMLASIAHKILLACWWAGSTFADGVGATCDSKPHRASSTFVLMFPHAGTCERAHVCPPPQTTHSLNSPRRPTLLITLHAI